MVTSLVTGQSLYHAKKPGESGLIFYPSLPQKLQGTKEVGRPDFDITHPDDWPQWIRNLHSEHATVEIRGKVIIWWGGTVHDGIWMGDDNTFWMGGCWRDGIVLGGHFFNCMWVNGEKRAGHIHSGTWHNGIHRGGSFSGLWLGGVWMGGEWDGYREKSPTPPDVATGDGYAF